MKLLILSLCVAFAVADVSHVARRTEGDSLAQIVKQVLDLNPDGTYQWAYETENGISASENGNVGQTNDGEPSLRVQGEVSWVAPDGQPVSVQYVADENGYQAQGTFIPTPPPIPVLIQKSLEYIRAHPPPPEKP